MFLFFYVIKHFNHLKIIVAPGRHFENLEFQCTLKEKIYETQIMELKVS